MQKEPEFSYSEIMQSLLRAPVQVEVVGVPSRDFYSFKSLRAIGEGGIFFVSSEMGDPPTLHNSVVLHAGGGCVGAGNVLVQVENPQLVFYKLMSELIGRVKPACGIHPTAIVAPNCEIDPSASIGPYCVLDGCQVGANAVLHAHVVVMPGSLIEDDVTIEPHSTIGATGVAWAWDRETRERIVQPQIGFTTIGRATFLGSDVTVVRGSVNETTYVGEGCVIAHGSKIGHGTSIGEGCHFANNVSIAGNVTLGARCFLGSAAVVRPQVSLVDQVVVGAGAVVVGDCNEAGALLMGVPAKAVLERRVTLKGVPRSFD